MPKKNKKTQSADPHEGRPALSTFGDLLEVKLKAASGGNLNMDDNFPALSSSSGPREVGTQGSQSGVSGAWEKKSSSISSMACSTSQAICSAEQSLTFPVQPPQSAQSTPSSLFICRTKKGGIPVKVDKRSSGKKVTLVENVEGDAKTLLQELKSKFGTGGIVKDGALELQGDCLVKITKYLNENKHLLRPYGTKS